jgi:hypothetical protein
MLRTSLYYVAPIFIWGSLGLWGLAFRAVISQRGQPIPMTPSLVFQAVAYGPIAFLVNWRAVSRRHATQARKYRVGVEGEDPETQ